jgi:hypothetical protein
MLGLGINQYNFLNKGKALQFYCIEYFKNCLGASNSKRDCGIMNYNVLQSNKFELIAHKLTFKLVGTTTATVITTIKKATKAGMSLHHLL